MKGAWRNYHHRSMQNCVIVLPVISQRHQRSCCKYLMEVYSGEYPVICKICYILQQLSLTSHSIGSDVRIIVSIYIECRNLRVAFSFCFDSQSNFSGCKKIIPAFSALVSYLFFSSQQDINVDSFCTEIRRQQCLELPVTELQQK